MLSRRTVLLAAPLVGEMAAGEFALSAATSNKMTLCIHQNTSHGAGYRKSLEGWAKAGVKNVEIADSSLDEFLKSDTIDAARRIPKDLGLNVVSTAAVISDLWIQGPNRVKNLDTWKQRCEQFAALGSNKVYCPAVTVRKVSAEDYNTAPEVIREVGEAAKQFNVTGMIEFARSSSFIATLTTALKLIRETAHPNIKPMLDCYHFWSGQNKFEDLDLLQPGELAHVHFQDVPDMPRELLGSSTRVIPGDGVSPLVKILKKLQEKGYAGALSVELFLPEFQQADPYELAKTIREKAEAVMRQAKVI